MTQLITHVKLIAAIAAIFRQAGSLVLEAQKVASNLVEANLRGHDSHGVGMVPRYMDAVFEGGLKPNTSVSVKLDTGSLLTLDGHQGYGQVIGEQAMSMAIERARFHGVCLMGLAHSHHLGRIGHWAEQAVAQGMVSIHFVNVISRALVAPFGGRDARFGTNPLAIGLPIQGPAVRCHANERLKLERLCRYITRPALANDRVKINAKGQVELKLKTPWRDGTTHHVMSPLEFMQRLAALVPRPRLHLIRFHGVLAPNAKWRSKVVPQAPNDTKLLPATPTATDKQEPPEQGRPMRLGWAKLLKRVFNLDLTHCPHCGGPLRIVAAILQRQAIEKILNHIGLDPQPPPRAPARGQMAF